MLSNMFDIIFNKYGTIPSNENDLQSVVIVMKVYRDLHHCLRKVSLQGKSGWSLGVCRGPCGARLPSPVVGGTDSLVWSVERYALHGMVNP